MVNGFGCTKYWSFSPAPTLSLDNSRMDPQRYHHTRRERSISSHRFPHPHLQYHDFHYAAQPVQEMRGHSINFHPSLTDPSHTRSTISSNTSSMPIQNAPFLNAHVHHPQPPRLWRNLPPRLQRNLPPRLQRNLSPQTFLQDDDVICHSLYTLGTYNSLDFI